MRSAALVGLAAIVFCASIPLPFCAAATVAPANAARLTIQLLDAPVASRSDPRARIYIVDQVHAGAAIVRHVKVTNETPAPIVASMYAGAASVGGDEFRFGSGAATDELTRWTSVVPAAADLGPGQSIEVTVTVGVPAGAVAGERYAVIWAQVGGSPSAGSTIRVVNRVGIRIYLSVAGATQLTSAFNIGTISATRSSSGLSVVSAAVRNTGQRALDLAGTLGLADGPSHLSAGPFTTDRTATLAPGQSGQVQFSLGRDVPPGRWTATVALASGTTRATVHATIDLPAQAGVVVAARPAPSSSSPWLMVGLGGGIGAVLLLAVLLVVWLERSRTLKSGATTRSRR